MYCHIIRKPPHFALLKRDQNYPTQLNLLSEKPIVFYDVEDRRAWLVDGASALLHLVHESLRIEEENLKGCGEWVFDSSQLKDSWGECSTRKAALRTLRHSDNWHLKVYVKETTLGDDGEERKIYCTFREQVDFVLRGLRAIISERWTNSWENRAGFELTLGFHRKIEGVDIEDIVSLRNPIPIRTMPMKSGKHGWVEMVHSSGMVTIFGTGFGNLIQPDNPADVCKAWQSVPTGMDYMAVSLSTMKWIHDKFLRRRHPGLEPGQVTEELVWTAPGGDPFVSCGCLHSDTQDGFVHVDPVQILRPKASEFMQSWLVPCLPSVSSHPRRSLVDIPNLGDTGVIIFDCAAPRWG